ncbi:MAG: hypothetical protein QOF61_1044 [Acidobacteriota bacterium]|nr:hypothetical protein [Acidobacteriota bacterium]
MVLTGHLDDRPLPDIIRTLRAQRKSGRLQVEYPDAPGAFFFEDGQLVDAQMGALRGVEAIYAALSMRGASFNFNPLVRPPERSIDRQGQKFISDLVETPRRENLSEIRVAGSELRAAPAAAPQLQPATAALPPAPQNALVRLEPTAAAELTAPLEARLTAVESAIANTARRFSRERLIYAVVISFLVGLTVVTALQAIFGRWRDERASAIASAPANTKPESSNATSATSTTGATSATGATEVATKDDAGAATQASGAATPNASQEKAGGNVVEISRAAVLQALGATKKERSSASKQLLALNAAAAREARKTNSESAPGSYVVHVLMEVKDGRVTQARVLNPRAGAGAYEALALRMARQRRYPDNFTGGDTLKVRVNP